MLDGCIYIHDARTTPDASGQWSGGVKKLEIWRKMRHKIITATINKLKIKKERMLVFGGQYNMIQRNYDLKKQSLPVFLLIVCLH